MQELAYKKVAETIGSTPRDIIKGKNYKLLDSDGVNYIPLGKCLENNLEVYGHPMDLSFVRTLRFELNNDHPLLKRTIYGQDSVYYEKLNIYPDEKVPSETGGRKKTKKRSKNNKIKSKRKPKTQYKRKVNK